KYYSDNGADEIIIFDLSVSDFEHEQSIGIIKEIARVIEIPMIAGGNIKRAEDVKKLLYAGASKAMLNYAKEENIALTEEVSKRFGKEKLAVCVDSAQQIYKNKAQIEEFVSLLVAIKEIELEKNQAIIPVKIFALLDTIDLGYLIKTLYLDIVEGVSGELINSTETDLLRVKAACKAADINVDLFESEMKWSEFKLNSDGMIPVVAQDHKTKEGGRRAQTKEEAGQKTRETGKR
ncbi:hypothetical protein CG709_08205, partial [Lachnotalea glycerini]